MKYDLKNKLNILLKSGIIFLMVIILESQTNNVVLNAQNSNLNKQLDLNSFALLDLSNIDYQEPEINVLQTEDKKEENINEETNEDKEKQEIINNVLATYSGKMTGYVYNCPSCSGKLACDPTINLASGNINYQDSTYGNVRIVASSTNLECGSIVSIKADSISNEPITAIVLDRGVSGTKLDLLSSSVNDARKNVGNTDITYDVLRKGY